MELTEAQLYALADQLFIDGLKTRCIQQFHAFWDHFAETLDFRSISADFVLATRIAYEKELTNFHEVIQLFALHKLSSHYSHVDEAWQMLMLDIPQVGVEFCKSVLKIVYSSSMSGGILDRFTLRALLKCTQEARGLSSDKSL